MRLWRRRRIDTIRDWEMVTLQADIARLEWQLGITDEPPPTFDISALNFSEWKRQYEQLKQAQQEGLA